MNAAVKSMLIYGAKNAVNAGILSAIEIFHDPKDNNLTSWHGLAGIGWMVGSAILAREGVIWIPKLLKWSTTTEAI